MAFLEPSTLVYGIADLPANLYGGLVHSSERIHRQPSIIPSHNFIPLHNNALFRRRELLFPHSSTCAVPICQLKSRDYKTELNRLSRTRTDIYLKPEYHSMEQNRNLLTGEATAFNSGFKGENAVRLWTVDDNSNRKLIQQFDVVFDIPSDFHKPIRINRNEDPLRDGTNILLDSEALELRVYDQYEQSDKVLIRCVNDLNLYDSSTKEVSKIYKWPVKYFERIAYMDEVAIVNNEGLVFYGPVGSDEFTRVKSDSKIISVATTDSPADLLLVSKSDIYQADTRSHGSNDVSIFDLKKENWKIVDPLREEGIEYMKDRERIWHVKCVRPETETYFVTTTKCIYVFDRRIPNLPIFYTNHFDFNGGEYCLTGGPFIHNELEIDVYQYFSLSRILNPSISHWAVGWNKRELVWTSMGSKCTVESPQEIVTLCRAQSYLPTLSTIVKDNLPEVTRAIHYQQFPESLRPNENRAILFRQMDNGQIWFDSINFAKPKAYCLHEGVEKVPAETKRSVDEIVDFLGVEAPLRLFWEFVDKSALVSFEDQNKPQDYTKFMERVSTNVDEWSSIMNAGVSHIELDDIDALLVPSETSQYNLLQDAATRPLSDQHTISQVILKMTEKAKLWMTETPEQQRLGDMYEDEDIAEIGDSFD